jgi:hypothetical protein
MLVKNMRKKTDFEVTETLIALMLEAARTSETSVDIDLTTWQYIPEDSEVLSNRSLFYYKGNSKSNVPYFLFK